MLGADTSQVAPKLAQLIADVEAGNEDSFKLKDFLAEYNPTRSRMAELLKSRPGRPRPERPRFKSTFPGGVRRSRPFPSKLCYTRLAGDEQISPAQKYICPCPDCDHSWYRRDAGQDIPSCPTHNVKLIPDQNS